MQQPTYWAGKFAAVFLALLPYFFFRVFFNGLPQQPETPSKTPSEAAVDMGEKGSAMETRMEMEMQSKKVENATGKESKSKSKSSDESTESIEPVEPVESKPADSQPAEAGSASKDESQPVRPSSA